MGRRVQSLYIKRKDNRARRRTNARYLSNDDTTLSGTNRGYLKCSRGTDEQTSTRLFQGKTIEDMISPRQRRRNPRCVRQQGWRPKERLNNPEASDTTRMLIYSTSIDAYSLARRVGVGRDALHIEAITRTASDTEVDIAELCLSVSF